MTVEYLLAYLKPFYPTWDDARARQLVRQFDLPVDRQLRHLSRGMRMKIALASSLAYRPRLLIMDEPFSGLDPLVREDLIDGLLESAGETTILISSHDLGEIESFASHIGYLDRGRLQFSEEMASLTARFREVEVTVDSPPLLPSGPALALALAAPGNCAGHGAIRRNALRCRAHRRRNSPRLWRRARYFRASHAAARHLRHSCARQFQGRLKENLMRQALHIFTKDIRYLRYEIALVLAIDLVFAAMHARTSHASERFLLGRIGLDCGGGVSDRPVGAGRGDSRRPPVLDHAALSLAKPAGREAPVHCCFRESCPFCWPSSSF